MLIRPTPLFGRSSSKSGPTPGEIKWYSTGAFPQNGFGANRTTLGLNDFKFNKVVLGNRSHVNNDRGGIAVFYGILDGVLYTSGLNENHVTLAGTFTGSKTAITPAISAASFTDVAHVWGRTANYGYLYRENGDGYSFGADFNLGYLAMGSAANITNVNITQRPLLSGHSILMAKDALFATTSGDIYGWGNRIGNRLGDGFTSTSASSAQPTPTIVSTIPNLVKFDQAATVIVAIDSDGNLWGAGYPQAAFYDSPTLATFRSARMDSAPLITDGSFQDIATSGSHSIAVRNGELWAIGRNTYGQLGDGTTSDSLVWKLIDNSRVWSKVYSTNNVTDSTTQPVSCAALDVDGNLFVWGANQNGRIGTGLSAGNTLSPTQIGAGLQFDEVVMGEGSMWARLKT